MPGLLDEQRLERVFNAWRRAMRLDPLLSRVAMPELLPLAASFNNALTGDDDGNLSEACNVLVRARLEPLHVIRITTFLAETFTDEVGNTSGAVTKSLVGTLGHVCGLMAQTMVDDMSALAHRDSLTGLENRRAWDHMLAGEMHAGRSVAIAMVDLDGLKAINDSVGHEAGDAHLKKFAADLRGAVPESGRVYRLGGDEYAVLLPQSGPEPLRDVLQGLLDREDGAMFSYGIAHSDESDGDTAALERIADERMYAMKRLHKNG